MPILTLPVPSPLSSLQQQQQLNNHKQPIILDIDTSPVQLEGEWEKETETRKETETEKEKEKERLGESEGWSPTMPHPVLLPLSLLQDHALIRALKQCQCLLIAREPQPTTPPSLVLSPRRILWPRGPSSKCPSNTMLAPLQKANFPHLVLFLSSPSHLPPDGQSWIPWHALILQAAHLAITHSHLTQLHICVAYNVEESMGDLLRQERQNSSSPYHYPSQGGIMEDDDMAEEPSVQEEFLTSLPGMQAYTALLTLGQGGRLAAVLDQVALATDDHRPFYLPSPFAFKCAQHAILHLQWGRGNGPAVPGTATFPPRPLDTLPDDDLQRVPTASAPPITSTVPSGGEAYIHQMRQLHPEDGRLQPTAKKLKLSHDWRSDQARLHWQ